MDSTRIIFAPYQMEQLSKRFEDSIPFLLREEYAKDHRLFSLEGRIALEDIADCLTKEEQRHLVGEYPDGKLGVWATRSSNKTMWSYIVRDSSIVFCSKKRLTYLAKGVLTMESEKIGERIWNRYWNLIIFLKVVKFVNADWKQFCEKANCPPFYPQKFMSPSVVRTPNFKKAIESYL